MITLKELYNHKCVCGKILRDHDIGSVGTVQGWNILKMYYDLGTCDLKIESIRSIPNGFGCLDTYKYKDGK